MVENQGIVLRVQAPYRHTISLFDGMQGRIQAVAQTAAFPLMHGELIAYRLEPWKHMYRLCDIQALKLPAAWVRNDILFLHHLLEMAHVFIPEQSRAVELFKLCGLLYETDAYHIEHRLLKKLFLGKFFALLGVYPEYAFQKETQLFHLFSGLGDEMPQEIQNIDELHEKLKHWLLGCIQTHPHAKTFTTMHFLYAQSE